MAHGLTHFYQQGGHAIIRHTKQLTEEAMNYTHFCPNSIRVSDEVIPQAMPMRGKPRSGPTVVFPVTLYGIHLIDGTVFEVLEETSSTTEMTLPEVIAAHRDEDLLCLGDPFNGFNFIPRRSILYVSQMEVQHIEDVISPFRVFNASLPPSS